MQRYFIDNNLNNDKLVSITGEDRHHIINVMRMTTGDQIVVCYPDGEAFLCVIKQIDEATVICEKIERLQEQRELPIKVTIAQGLLKGDKLELVIQKGTELGMNGFIPLQLSLSVAKWNQKK